MSNEDYTPIPYSLKSVTAQANRNKTRIAKLKQEIAVARSSGNRVKAVQLANRLNKMGGSEDY